MKFGIRLDARVRSVIEPQLGEEQCAFRKGRSTGDLLGFIRRVMEARDRAGLRTYLAFLDLEKAFDRVPRELLFRVLRNYGVPDELVELIKATYKNSVSSVRTAQGYTEEFEVKVGLHQGSALSPLLFLVLMDSVSKHILSQEWWDRGLYADDVALLASSLQGRQRRLQVWDQMLERYGMNLNLEKSVVMVADRNEKEVTRLTVRGHVLKQVDSFKYLGSTLSSDLRCEEAVSARIAAGAAKFGALAPVLLDKKMPRSVRAFGFKSAVQPSLLYGLDSCALIVRQVTRLEKFHSVCLRRIHGAKWWEKVPNVVIRKELGVAPFEDRVRSRVLRLWGHTMRMKEERFPKKAQSVKFAVGKKRKGRPPSTWRDVVESSLEKFQIMQEEAEELAQSRSYWRLVTSVPDPPSLCRLARQGKVG